MEPAVSFHPLPGRCQAERCRLTADMHSPPAGVCVSGHCSPDRAPVSALVAVWLVSRECRMFAITGRVKSTRASDARLDYVSPGRKHVGRKQPDPPLGSGDGQSVANSTTAAWLISLQRAAGNRAVASLQIQLSPDKRAGEKEANLATKEKTSGTEALTDLKLPWSWGDYTAFALTVSGIQFLVAVGKTQESGVRAAIPKLGSRIAADNAAIADQARKVMNCFITPATTRFAYWGSKAVLMIDPADANVPTVAHEMGHAVLDALMQGEATAAKSKAGGAAAIPLRVADLYLRLQQTKVPKESTVSVGLMMVDPSEWAPGEKSEHPWTNADEFFASAKEAYQVNKKGLLASIARATKADKTVGPLAQELLALLDAVYGKRKSPTGPLPKDRSAAATTELRRVAAASQIVDSIAAYPLLGWLIDPNTRPGRR